MRAIKTLKIWWKDYLFSKWFILGIGATPIFLIIISFYIVADVLAFLWFISIVVVSFFGGFCYKCGHKTIDHRGRTSCPKCDLE